MLKLKNRVVHRLSQLDTQITTCNSVIEDNQEYDVRQLYKARLLLAEQLVKPSTRHGVRRTKAGAGNEVGPSAWAALGGQPPGMWQPFIYNVPDPDADTDFKTQGSPLRLVTSDSMIEPVARNFHSCLSQLKFVCAVSWSTNVVSPLPCTQGRG